ncbi:MAG: hypothetical protein DSM106950_07815, partial [Stigonema ocellatum SAG 48.90 = DSM 106950]|nr:hypothetical protein [Stigonema ocellatum SAG 48.90 = DSM 106950]
KTAIQLLSWRFPLGEAWIAVKKAIQATFGLYPFGVWLFYRTLHPTPHPPHPTPHFWSTINNSHSPLGLKPQAIPTPYFFQYGG